MNKSLWMSLVLSGVVSGGLGCVDSAKADDTSTKKDTHTARVNEKTGVKAKTSESNTASSVRKKADTDKPLPEQWYTGSLYSPSPALPEAGMIAVEPYVAASLPAGAFGSNGHLNKNVGSQHSISQYTLAKVGITDHLSLYMLPAYSYSWGNHTKSSGLKFNDLPVEFEYRLTPHYTPSVSVYLGFNAPTGDYSNLANASEGVGQGAWFIRYGLHTQFALPFFNHAMRVRLWAQGRQPVSSARLHNISSYGTEQGFDGRAHPGPFGDEGSAFEFGLTKRWVVALDLYHSWSSSTKLRGYNRNTGAMTHTRTGWSGVFNVGPALEYNFSSTVGAVAGVIVPVAGHNASRSIQPQCAVFAMF